MDIELTDPLDPGPLDHTADSLWADLAAASRQALDPSEIAGLFAVVARGARSAAAARRLGPAHGVVRLAADVVAGRRVLGPDRSALAVVVGAYLAEPALSERWFGYTLDKYESDAFAGGATRALADEARSPGKKDGR